MDSDILYAIYPGTVTLYDGSQRTLTALELATEYGVEDESYLTVNSPTDIPRDETHLRYIHLKPRADNIYPDMKDSEHLQDDDEQVTWGADFDGDKQYTQETRRGQRLDT